MKYSPCVCENHRVENKEKRRRIEQPIPSTFSYLHLLSEAEEMAFLNLISLSPHSTRNGLNEFQTRFYECEKRR